MWHLRTNRWLLGSILAAAGLGLMTPAGVASSEPAVVLADHFDNGVPADSDTTAAFWSIGHSDGTVTVVENRNSNGLLEMTLAGGTGKSLPKLVLASAVKREFNFATGQVCLSVKGVRIQSQGGGAKPWDSVMRFSFTSLSGHPWLAPDAVTLMLTDSGEAILGWKTGQPHKDPQVIKAVSANAGTLKLGTITGFDLTLGPARYQLVLHGTQKSETFAGVYADKGGLKPWGNSALVIDCQRNTPNPAISSQDSLDSVVVTRSSP